MQLRPGEVGYIHSVYTFYFFFVDSIRHSALDIIYKSAYILSWIEATLLYIKFWLFLDKISLISFYCLY